MYLEHIKFLQYKANSINRITSVNSTILEFVCIRLPNYYSLSTINTNFRSLKAPSCSSSDHGSHIESAPTSLSNIKPDTHEDSQFGIRRFMEDLGTCIR